jgi:hypothetical protein
MKANENFELSEKMKCFLLRVIIGFFFLAIALIADAQITSPKLEKEKWNVSALYLSAGKTSLTSGIAIAGDVCKGKSLVNITLNGDLQQIIYDYSLNKWVSVQATGGFFYNVPWAGPAVVFKMFDKHLITTHWFGWAAGIPEENKVNFNKTIFCFSYQEIRFTSKYLDSYYVLLHYENNKPAHYLGLKGKVYFNEKLSLFSDISYAYPDKEWLLSMGIGYNF